MQLFILYRKRGIFGTHFVQEAQASKLNVVDSVDSKKLADGHLLFLFFSLIIQTGGVSSFFFQNSLLHWGTKHLSHAISKVHLFIVALGHYKNKENHGTR